MTFPFTSDAAAIFQGGDFGTATFTHGTGSATTVYGMFDDHYRDPLGIEGNSPRFACAIADVPSVAHGDTLVVGTSTYAVRGVNEDGIGSVWLQLEEQ